MTPDEFVDDMLLNHKELHDKTSESLIVGFILPQLLERGMKIPNDQEMTLFLNHVLTSAYEEVTTKFNSDELDTISRLLVSHFNPDTTQEEELLMDKALPIMSSAVFESCIRSKQLLGI